MSQTFQSLGLSSELLNTLESLGYTEPTPIQIQAIPTILSGTDVVGQAQTGTGKTAAFTLPLLQQLSGDDLQILILTPTRELAIQVSEAVHRYGESMGVRVLPVYGGQDYERQIRRLTRGVHVVVGTPGRTLDLINKRHLKLDKIRFVVLDEADEMLNMGFIDDMESILKATDAKTRQTLLFSATFTTEIRTLSARYMRNPAHVTIESKEMTNEHVEEIYFAVEERDKLGALCRILEVEAQNNTLIFTRTKAGAAELAERLVERGFPASAIHGDLAQAERERILDRFRSGKVAILVATDVMARGVDISDVSHVVNYDIPQLANEYVHRIGRTGRAGRAGKAITLISPKQRRQLQMIENYTRKTMVRGKLPRREDVIIRRQEQFMLDLLTALPNAKSERDLLEELISQGFSAEDIAGRLIHLLIAQQSYPPLEEIELVKEYKDRRDIKTTLVDRGGDSPSRSRNRNKREREEGMVRLQMNLGNKNGIRPADVVANIASRAKIPGSVIGAIDIRQNETYVDVPEAHVDVVIKRMKNSKIRGHDLQVVKA